MVSRPTETSGMAARIAWTSVSALPRKKVDPIDVGPAPVIAVGAALAVATRLGAMRAGADVVDMSWQRATIGMGKESGSNAAQQLIAHSAGHRPNEQTSSCPNESAAASRRRRRRRSGAMDAPTAATRQTTWTSSQAARRRGDNQATECRSCGNSEGGQRGQRTIDMHT